MEKIKFNDVEAYITSFPEETKSLLIQLRSIILKTAPLAQESISYNMPAYKYKGMLVYFCAYKNHIGLYPMASTIAHFKDELKSFKTSKGTVQLSLDQKIPLVLIEEMIKFRMKRNEEKETIKSKQK